jgi:hypothetical protein
MKGSLQPNPIGTILFSILHKAVQERMQFNMRVTDHDERGYPNTNEDYIVRAMQFAIYYLTTRN